MRKQQYYKLRMHEYDPDSQSLIVFVERLGIGRIDEAGK